MQGPSQKGADCEDSDHGWREAGLLARVCDDQSNSNTDCDVAVLEQLKNTSVVHQSHQERQSIT
jgi:hypothetical protein